MVDRSENQHASGEFSGRADPEAGASLSGGASGSDRCAPPPDHRDSLYGRSWRMSRKFPLSSGRCLCIPCPKQCSEKTEGWCPAFPFCTHRSAERCFCTPRARISSGDHHIIGRKHCGQQPCGPFNPSIRFLTADPAFPGYLAFGRV